jgi:hypothetical protein
MNNNARACDAVSSIGNEYVCWDGSEENDCGCQENMEGGDMK